MKIVSFTQNGRAGFGVLSSSEEAIVDATEAYESLRRVLENDQLDELQDWASTKEASLPISDIRFLSPVPDAKRVICIGVNYQKVHPVNGVIPPPENISLFSKFEGSLVGHQECLLRPEQTDSFDYEGEITLVIGKRASQLSVENATDVLAGVTILNDGSVREWQKHSVAAGKNFAAASSIGPWMATMDEIGDYREIHLKTFLNGYKVQDVKASEMLFDIPSLLVYVSQFTTLEPGDILSTGSPERSKLPDRESQYLQVGDVVDVEISGVGRLTNEVVSRSW